MSRGRTPHKAALIARACNFVEFLEDRKYLTTLKSDAGGQSTFDYKDASGNEIRVKLVNKITVELVGARVRGDGSLVIRDLVAFPPPGATPTPDGVNLFQVYVAAAAPDAEIIITKIAPDTSGHLNPSPYAGGAAININPNVGTTRGETLDQGAVYIGARTPTGTDPNTGNIPIVYSPSRIGIGVRPAGKGYFAGIQTAPGVSLNKVLIGGTVTGIVNIEGNVQEFYAGNILTGDATGLAYGAKTSIANNFTVGGDLRALLVSGSVGTTVGNIGIYRSGVNIRVGGKLGYFHVGEDNSSSVTVNNNSSVAGLTTPVQEAEYTLLPQQTVNDVFLDQGELSGSFFKNDSTTAEGTAAVENNFQFSNSYTSSTTGAAQSEEFQGTLDGVDGDNTDAYGLPLLAGQSVTLHLVSDATGDVGQLGVFDPLGRLVATDLPGIVGVSNRPFVLTAKVPGVYRLVVAMPGDTLFNGTGPNKVPVGYTLSATGVGEVALGGMDTGGNAALMEPGTGVAVRLGDIGALQTGGEFAAASATIGLGISSDIAAAKGNLRALTAAQIGSETASTIGSETSRINLMGDLAIPRGSVGYIHSTGLLALNPGASLADGTVVPTAAIGFDYQRVEAGGDLDASLVANGAIGTIVANNIGQSDLFLRPVFSADTDNKGDDGFIDEIYVTNNFGAASVGGPVLYTGTGGNVKYIHVGGIAYRDQQFGGSELTDINGKPGVAQTFTDDSGATIVLTPTTVIQRSTTGTAGTITTDIGALSTLYYPMRNGGGVIISVTSGTSLTAATTTRGGSVDIGQITTDGVGSPVIYSATFNSTGYAPGTSTGTGTTGTLVSAAPLLPNAITFSGSAPINVMNIIGNDVTQISNTTGGEISGVNVASLGYFSAQSAGFIKSNTAAEVDVPSNISSTAFPFNPYSYGLNVTGSAVSVSVRDGLGNFNAGNVAGTIVTNADGKNTKGLLDGIAGSVAARVIQSVNIGEGIAATGTGSVVGGGIFGIGSTADIQRVFGRNADVRGYIASEGDIGTITLINGSLLGARVVTASTIAQAVYTNNEFTGGDTEFNAGQSETPGGTLILPPGQTIDQTDYSLGNLTITGTGGILGSFINAGDFNTINAGGFGIVSSYIFSTATFNPDNVINAAGLGIRDSHLDVGSGINTINVTDGKALDGSVLDVSDFSPTARPSKSKSKFDLAGNGGLLDATNDLNRALGTSNATPAISGATNAGLLVDTTITGNNSIGSINAFLIGSVLSTLDPSSTTYPMRISVANAVRKISATYVDGMQLRTGNLGTLSVAKNVLHASIGTTNTIGAIKVGGNLLGSVTINNSGQQGTIDSIHVVKALNATITSRGTINGIEAGSIGGTINTSNNINTLLVDGDLLPTANIRARKKINVLDILGDVETGATVTAASYGTKHIGGKNHGTITTA